MDETLAELEREYERLRVLAHDAPREGPGRSATRTHARLVDEMIVAKERIDNLRAAMEAGR